jgi:methyl-accepting chemotaxis protein
MAWFHNRHLKKGETLIMFSNLTIKTKLYLLSGVGMLFLAILAVTSYVGMERMESLSDDLASSDAKLVELSQRERVNINLMRRFEKDLFINVGDIAKMEEYEKKWEGARDAFFKRLEESAKLVENSATPDSAKNMETIAFIKKNIEIYAGGFTAIYEQIKAGNIKTTQDANKAMGQYKEATRNADTQVEDFAKKMDEQMAEMVKETISGSNKTQMVLLIVAIIAAALAAIQAFLVIRSITVPLAKLITVSHAIAKGDLTTCVEVTSKDELGELMGAMKTMNENLRMVIGEVSDASAQVSSAANQLTATAKEIAEGTEEVVAQTNTVATAGEEMTATSHDIAKNCLFASEGAQRAARTAQEGSAVVEATINVMNQIASKVQESAKTVESLGERSDQIGAIVGTIEDIADQTNLLALNAAIEAARAGEQGRGFAVVADEVRALAERTTRATKEISDMIKTVQNETKVAVNVMEIGVTQVESGTKEATRSGEALQEILSQVNDVATQVQQIATAAEEQTAVTSEISSNMQQINDVVQQTARGSHESSMAAAQLSGNAEALQALVCKFRV